MRIMPNYRLVMKLFAWNDKASLLGGKFSGFPLLKNVPEKWGHPNSRFKIQDPKIQDQRSRSQDPEIEIPKSSHEPQLLGKEHTFTCNQRNNETELHTVFDFWILISGS